MLPLAQIPTPPFSGLDLGPLNIRLYGVVIAVGAFLALRMAVARYEEGGGDPELMEKAGLLALVGGFLGGRIGYIIPRFLYEGAHGDAYVTRPLDILAIWQGGLAFFGGLVGGTLTIVVYARLKRAGVPAMADALAPALPLAQAIGRWGNYFNQELFGRPTDLPWALRVDPGPAERAGYPGVSTFHPTFLYESLWNFALVGVILALDRRGTFRRRGSLIFVYLIGYGIGRGWIEVLRVDTFQRYFGLSRNNWVALLVVVIGVFGLWWWETRSSGPPVTDPPGDDPHGAEGATDVGNDTTGQPDAQGPKPEHGVDDLHGDGGDPEGSGDGRSRPA